MPIGIVHQERVWLEVVDLLVCFVDGGDVNDAPTLKVLKVHVGVAELLLALLEAARQVALGCLRHLLLHLRVALSARRVAFSSHDL